MEIPRHNPFASDRPQPAPSGAASAGAGGRLNLLLSYAGWQPDSWADRLPRLLEPMGVRSLRANSGKQASEVLRASTVHIAVVDLGLPLDETQCESEEGGPRLLDLLFRLPEPPPTVVVKRSRTHRDDCREMAAALRSGAFAVIDRPRNSSDLEILLDVLSRCLSRFYQGRWPGIA